VARAAARRERRLRDRAAEYAALRCADDLGALAVDFEERDCPASAGSTPKLTSAESARVPNQKKGFLCTQAIPNL
jgi:hypothetical protein